MEPPQVTRARAIDDYELEKQDEPTHTHTRMHTSMMHMTHNPDAMDDDQPCPLFQFLRGRRTTSASSSRIPLVVMTAGVLGAFIGSIAMYNYAIFWGGMGCSCPLASCLVSSATATAATVTVTHTLLVPSPTATTALSGVSLIAIATATQTGFTTPSAPTSLPPAAVPFVACGSNYHASDRGGGLYETQCHTNYNGNDITHLALPSFERCVDECERWNEKRGAGSPAEKSACVGVIWQYADKAHSLPWVEGLCWLKKDMEKALYSPQDTAALLLNSTGT